MSTKYGKDGWDHRREQLERIQRRAEREKAEGERDDSLSITPDPASEIREERK